MSEENPIGLLIAEKVFGLLILIIGVAAIYITCNDPPGGLVAPFFPVFIAAGLALVVIGVFLVLGKAE